MKKTTTTMSNLKILMNERIEQIPLTQIEADRNWNCRKFIGDDSEGGPEEHTFSDLVDSILTTGQATAVGLRKKEGSDDHYCLVEGFRRHAAISRIYSQNKTVPNLKEGCIRAIISEMNDMEALIQNGRENTARAGLNMPDTAFLIHRLYSEFGLNDSVIASRLGLSQPYVSQLHAVYKGTANLRITMKDGSEITIFDHWRDAPGRVAFQTMLEFVRIKADPRVKELKYMALLDPKNQKSDRKQVVQRNEFSLAETYGVSLGRLAAKGLISIQGDWRDILLIGKRIRLSDNNPQYRDRVLACAKEGFERGLNTR